VLIAAPSIALMYILGTGALLAYVPPAKVDLAAPVSQMLQAGFGATGLGKTLTAVAVGTFNIGYIAAMVICIGMVARLPMVAGWDGLLPGWWSTLHPRLRTPYKAIGAVTATLMFLGCLSLWGAGNQEAVQVALAAGTGLVCIMYMLLFATPLFGFRSRLQRPAGLGIRLGALAALLVSFVSLIFEIVPLGDVASPAVFALKVAGTILAASALGAYLYWRGSRPVRNLVASSAAGGKPRSNE
jgi:amino acid transporter